MGAPEGPSGPDKWGPGSHLIDGCGRRFVPTDKAPAQPRRVVRVRRARRQNAHRNEAARGFRPTK